MFQISAKAQTKILKHWTEIQRTLSDSNHPQTNALGRKFASTLSNPNKKQLILSAASDLIWGDDMVDARRWEAIDLMMKLAGALFDIEAS